MAFEPNPYQAPTHEVAAAPPVTTAGGEQLATRGDRFLAATVDGLIAIALFFPLQYAAGTYDGFPNIKPQSYVQTLLWGLLSTAVWLALHGYFLHKSAQTIGKKLLGIQIVNFEDGKPTPITRIFLRRHLPFHMLATLIPKVGPILSFVNISFIFRKDQRCLHDYLAETRVIKLR